MGNELSEAELLKLEAIRQNRLRRFLPTAEECDFLLEIIRRLENAMREMEA